MTQGKNRYKISVIIITALTLVGAVCLCAALVMLFRHLKTPNVTETLADNALIVTSPEYGEFTTENKIITFNGICNTGYNLTLNSKPINTNPDGSFEAQVNLNKGVNTIILSSGGITYTYNITYEFLLIKNATPSNPLTTESNSVLYVSVSARKGSAVSAEFCGETLPLTCADNEDPAPNDFVQYTTTIKLSDSLKSDANLGPISFTATKDNEIQTIKSADISVKKAPDKPLIAEVIYQSAETFNGSSSDDYSHPNNSYLPKGTVDYCNSGTIINTSQNTSYKQLRFGKRVYEEAVKLYEGTLPQHNNLKFLKLNESDRYTTIVLKTDFKAPFKFEIKNQKYNDASIRDYTFNRATFSYIDIAFCYAKELTGAIDLSKNPIFKGYKIINNSNNTILRLYLKKTGNFYGWSAEYDSNGNLCFKFLKPAKITNANNDYGVSLSGATVFIDAGHGGDDVGAVSANGKFTESDLNLKLALCLKAELESIGATVKMSRTTNESIDPIDRAARLKNAQADLCVSIHRNASKSSSVSAFNTYHFNAFTKTAADLIYQSTQNLYKKTEHSGVKWHYFYMSRITDCPVVLTENGYITNAEELLKIIDDDFNKQCAKALTKGIVDYFITIQ